MVLAAIDESGYANRGVVAIEYVRADGEIRKMRVKKSVSNPHTGSDKRKTARGNYHVRNRGLIRVVDQENMQPKSLFIYAIIGFNPTGDTSRIYPVIHG